MKAEKYIKVCINYGMSLAVKNGTKMNDNGKNGMMKMGVILIGIFKKMTNICTKIGEENAESI